MVTTVGTENSYEKLVTDFIKLEHDAIAAYDATIAKLDDPSYKTKIEEFKMDHLRHLDDLRGLARECGVEAPQSGDAKELLTTGKIHLANLMGDAAILKAMSTNESDTVKAYENGFGNDNVPENAREIFARGLEDERRHKTWMDETAKRASDSH